MGLASLQHTAHTRNLTGHTRNFRSDKTLHFKAESQVVTSYTVQMCHLCHLLKWTWSLEAPPWEYIVMICSWLYHGNCIPISHIWSLHGTYLQDSLLTNPEGCSYCCKEGRTDPTTWKVVKIIGIRDACSTADIFNGCSSGLVVV